MSITVGPQVRQIEQPERISEDGKTWFFLHGYSGGFGAEYGVTLAREEVERRLTEQAGPGTLQRNESGRWYWRLN